MSGDPGNVWVSLSFRGGAGGRGVVASFHPHAQKGSSALGSLVWATAIVPIAITHADILSASVLIGDLPPAAA
jgi:hypothetical protein